MCDINTAIYVPRRLQHKSQSANIMCRVDPCKHTVSIVLLTLVNPSTNQYEYLELMTCYLHASHESRTTKQL